MHLNESRLDRAIRVVLGIALLGIGIGLLHGVLEILFIIVGAISLVTGITGFCALYRLLGLNTKKA
jgi:hypothetical protein